MGLPGGVERWPHALDVPGVVREGAQLLGGVPTRHHHVGHLLELRVVRIDQHHTVQPGE